MRLYTLVSHDCRVLPYQIPLLRKYAPGSPITAIVGPNGANPATSAGTVTVDPQWASANGISIWNAPDNLAGLTVLDRVREIVKAAWDGKEDTIFLHGDLLPIKPIDFDTIVDGTVCAGRVWPISSKPTFTWLAIREGATIPDVAGDNFRIYNSRREGSIEWCDPCWMHLDKIGMSWVPHLSAAWEGKMALAKDLMLRSGVETLEGIPCIDVHDPVNHRPRMMRPPEPIPEGFDQQAEVRRMLSGGCCGKPSAA